MNKWNTAPRSAVWALAVSCGISALAPNCVAELPDSPGSTVAQAQVQVAQVQSAQVQDRVQDRVQDQDQQPSSATTVSSESSPVTVAQATAQDTSQNTASPANKTQETQSGQKPVGTAAAGSVPSTGIAASQPAGTAIAPGKQRRVRSLVLKVGAIIGAGVAVGTIAGLTLATPSKPPGAR
jgi:hypothetical protein